MSSCKTDCSRQAFVHTDIGLAVFAFFLFFLSSFASAAPVIVIQDGSDKICLNNHVDILDNPEQALTINDIASRLHQFAPVDLSLNSALQGFSPSVWLRFSVINNSNSEQRLWLTANPGAIQSLSLYQLLPAEGARKIGDSPLQRSDLVPVLKELLIPAQASASFLIDAHILAGRTLDLHLLTPPTLLAELHSRTSSSSFALGLLSMLTLICGFITLYRRSTLFFYHSGFILAATGIYMIGLGLPRTVFENFADWQDTAIAILLFFTTSAGLLCIATYISNTRSDKPCLQILRYANYLNLVFSLPVIVLANNHAALMVIPAVLALPLIMFSLLSCYRQHNDTIALGIVLATLPSGIMLCMLLLLNLSTFSLDLLIDPALLYLVAATITTNSILFMVAEHRSILAGLDRQQQSLLDQTRHQAQNDLLQAFSGDIQTPLSGIMGMAELLKSSSLSTEQRANVDAIRNSGQLLLNRIADTHYRIQFDQNSENVRQSPFELDLLMENCINSFQLAAAEKNIELILQIQPDVPAIVKGDEYRLRQCLFRLLDNAIAHTEQGEVAVKVSKNANDNDIILFSVCDTGRGISEEQIASLGKPETAGIMKMGLNTVTEMLRQLQSELLIDSCDGEGSTFSFALELPAVETGNERNSNGDTILKYKNLLIVDDNKTSCKVLKQQATSWGMKVAEAHSGNEALAMYRAKHNLGETFDAIILDYDMPQVSGIEVAEKITLEARENQPVIIMLATLSQSPPEHIAKQAGVDNILSKPVSQKMLRLTLGNLFQMRQKSARTSAQASLRRLNVLVADDNDVIRSVISKILESLDVDYKMVSDGKLAVDAAKKEPFDVILMDCEMPFMNGFEATEQIHRWQQEKHRPQTPVIALTAYTLSEHKNKSKAAGMVDYLEKPINMIELEAVLQRFQP